MKKYIFSLVCLCCALLPALEGQAHEYPNHLNYVSQMPISLAIFLIKTPKNTCPI